MSKFDDLLAKADTAEPDFQDVPVTLARELVTMRFYVMPGEDWAELTASNPARPGVLIDANYGYNLHAVVKAAAVGCGRVVDGGDATERDATVWAKTFKLLSGHDVAAITDAVWGLNEWRPSQLVEQLKKASTTARKQKRS